MSGAATSPSVLRLVNTETAAVLSAGITPQTAAGEVWAENLSSSRLSATDARWVLAVRTTMALQGGAAAILRPDDRRSLVALAEQMGLRSFDAALVIAIAQDAARTGEPLSGSPHDRLRMVSSARSDESLGIGSLLLISCFLGLLFFSLWRAFLLG